MTQIMKKTVEEGTLAHGAGWGSKFTFKDSNGKSFRMPAAGKTGTPQNWSDAWAVGYTPYYTTAIWFGFDKPGNSLGVELTGSTLAGPVWGDYMREIHQGHAYKDFIRPGTGIIDVTVCAKSGLLKTSACNEGDVTMPFLEGTQPSQYCNIHGNASYSSGTAINTMRGDTLSIDDEILLGSLTMPTLRLDLFQEPENETNQSNRNNTSQNRRTTSPPASNSRTNSSRDSRGRSSAPANSGNQGNQTSPLSWSFNNPLMDDDEFVPETTSPETEDSYGLELPSYNPLLD
jgi:penicillin-binding protein 1A